MASLIRALLREGVKGGLTLRLGVLLGVAVKLLISSCDKLIPKEVGLQGVN